MTRASPLMGATPAPPTPGIGHSTASADARASATSLKTGCPVCCPERAAPDTPRHIDNPEISFRRPDLPHRSPRTGTKGTALAPRTNPIHADPPGHERTRRMAEQRRLPRYRTVDVLLPRQRTRYRPRSPRITGPADLPALPRTHPVPRARPDDGRTVRNLGRHDRKRPQTTHQPSSPRRAPTPRAPARDTGHRRRPAPELRPVTTASSTASRRPHHPTENPGSTPEYEPDQRLWTTQHPVEHRRPRRPNASTTRCSRPRKRARCYPKRRNTDCHRSR